MRLMLSSAGLENEVIQSCFLNLLGRDVKDVHPLFIPTAAIHPGAIAMLPKCMNDLLKCGIPEENITVFDLHREMPLEELRRFDLVYLCGGSTGYLLKRINESGFRESLLAYIRENGLVLGVSAGSMIFANNLPENLGLLDARLEVHCQTEENPGKLGEKHSIQLTNDCTLVLDGTEITVVGTGAAMR